MSNDHIVIKSRTMPAEFTMKCILIIHDSCRAYSVFGCWAIRSVIYLDTHRMLFHGTRVNVSESIFMDEPLFIIIQPLVAFVLLGSADVVYLFQGRLVDVLLGGTVTLNAVSSSVWVLVHNLNLDPLF